ncbi:Crp/Fnr family transcriptional regulator [Chitinophaga sp. Cy-1792]|uniref:Crp/Fnr family transcriptional regulator n=1 Tax=Chitinophaga sp. Cy-1792 TaxID=2608339 RepID=UPI001F03C486|nr:Crp/Fnr family transcriptional regulator [Chitinophaga sp. Cy-1792]
MLLAFLRSLSNTFSDDAWHQLQPALTTHTYKKNDFLLKAGEVCKSLYFIEKGACRSFYDMDGIEKNTGFFFEGQIVTNITSLGNGDKSAYSIIVTEPTTAICFDRDKLFEISNGNKEIELLGRLCIRRFASIQEEFSKLFQLYSAEERLIYLENHHPEILQRVSLSQLASFLGVARETLSRIRKRRAIR